MSGGFKVKVKVKGSSAYLKYSLASIHGCLTIFNSLDCHASVRSLTSSLPIHPLSSCLATFYPFITIYPLVPSFVRRWGFYVAHCE